MFHHDTSPRLCVYVSLCEALQRRPDDILLAAFPCADIPSRSLITEGNIKTARTAGVALASTRKKHFVSPQGDRQPNLLWRHPCGEQMPRPLLSPRLGGGGGFFFLCAWRLLFQGTNVNRVILSLAHARVTKTDAGPAWEGKVGGETAAKHESDLLVYNDSSGLRSTQESSPEGRGQRGGGRTEREQAGTEGRLGWGDKGTEGRIHGARREETEVLY